MTKLTTPFLSIENWIVTSKAEDPHTVMQGRLSKDVVPGLMRVKVFHGYGEKAESICWKAASEETQYVCSENLAIPAVRVNACCEPCALNI